ncbi:HAD family hydrolase [Psychromarinibacter sp. S121]|uniref:HAD family hydrolase n=1 Tax=Psychromarinibacter sp. S121 TaxID=3415127 RepID=UPI003C79F07C
MTPARPWLLVSDIDDTLTGDPAAMEALGKAMAADRDRLWFAVNSSRPAGSVAETLATVFPPALQPDGVITALGTEIAWQGAPLEGWEQRFHGWPHDRIFATLERLGHRPHAEVYQTPRKVSFAVPPDAQGAARDALADYDCTVIASGSDDFDVIPTAGGKDKAALFLTRYLGLDPDDLIVAGDSGNDLAMFRVSHMGIAVRNARSELLDALVPGTFHHAQAPHAGGVLEGLRHYGALPGKTAD